MYDLYNLEHCYMDQIFEAIEEVNIYLFLDSFGNIQFTQRPPTPRLKSQYFEIMKKTDVNFFTNWWLHIITQTTKFPC